MTTTRWVRTPCNDGACVEIGRLSYGDYAIRTNQFRARTVTITPNEMASFIQAVKNGHFDRLLKEIT